MHLVTVQQGNSALHTAVIFNSEKCLEALLMAKESQNAHWMPNAQDKKVT